MARSDTEFVASMLPGPAKKNAQISRVRVLSEVEAGGFSKIDNFAGLVGFEMVGVTVDVRQRTFALRVRGDSMHGRSGDSFPEGTIIVVEPDLAPEPGDYVVVVNEKNESTFKQLRSVEGALFLHPLNELYEAIPLGTSEIIGVVREAIQRFR